MLHDDDVNGNVYLPYVLARELIFTPEQTAVEYDADDIVAQGRRFFTIPIGDYCLLQFVHQEFLYGFRKQGQVGVFDAFRKLGGTKFRGRRQCSLASLTSDGECMLDNTR